MGPKSSVQTIVVDHLGSKYGHIRVKKRSFLPKNGQIDFFFGMARIRLFHRQTARAGHHGKSE